jgi:hypothetical protein
MALGKFVISISVILLLPGVSVGFAGEPSACEWVQLYGADLGGAESLGSIIEMNMRDWKPQSAKGIEIFGWDSRRLDEFSYRVTYSYVEHGCAPVVFEWKADMRSRSVLPMTDVSGRLMKMAEIF